MPGALVWFIRVIIVIIAVGGAIKMFNWARNTDNPTLVSRVRPFSRFSVSGRVTWFEGNKGLWAALWVPVWLWFWLEFIYELTANHHDTPGNYFWTNAWNHFWHWPPMFKWWGWLLYLLTVICLFWWRRTAHLWARRIVLFLMGLMALCGIGSWDGWHDMFHPVAANVAAYANNAELGVKCVTATDKTVTCTASGLQDGDTPHWQVRDQNGQPIKSSGDTLAYKDGSLDKQTTVTLSVLKSGAYKVKFWVTDKAGAPSRVIPVTQKVDKPTPVDCSTWAYKADAHKDGNFLSEGLASIWKVQSNPSDAQAKAAANDWIEQMKLAPENLQFVVKTVLNKDVTTADLQSNGCATTTAASYVTQLHDKINSAKVTVETAPADGHNTGVQNGTGVVESQSGVTGDRTAIKVVLDDGRTFWVMARCANVVFAGTPPSSIPTTTSPVSTPSHPTTPPLQHTTPPSHTTTPPQVTTPPPTHTGGKTASQMPPPPGGPNVGGTSTQPSRPTSTAPQQTVDPSQPTDEVNNPVNTPPPTDPDNTGDPAGA
jgi:hypothetical protein